MTKCYTDYPLFEEEYGKEAPMREVNPLSYDGDKYCQVEFEGKTYEIKSGYLYSNQIGVGEKGCKKFDCRCLPVED